MRCDFCGILDAEVKEYEGGDKYHEECKDHPNEYCPADTDNYFIESYYGGDR